MIPLGLQNLVSGQGEWLCVKESTPLLRRYLFYRSQFDEEQDLPWRILNSEHEDGQNADKRLLWRANAVPFRCLKQAYRLFVIYKLFSLYISHIILSTAIFSSHPVTFCQFYSLCTTSV